MFYAIPANHCWHLCNHKILPAKAIKVITSTSIRHIFSPASSRRDCGGLEAHRGTQMRLELLVGDAFCILRFLCKDSGSRLGSVVIKKERLITTHSRDVEHVKESQQQPLRTKQVHLSFLYSAATVMLQQIRRIFLFTSGFLFNFTAHNSDERFNPLLVQYIKPIKNGL